MTAHRSVLTLAAAAITAAVLLARWWMTSRSGAARPHRHPTGPTADDRAGDLPPALPDAAASDPVLREAEELLSGQWNRLRSLYPPHPDDSAPR
ncbi:hypothetical protein ACIBVL_41335 [Streptomyces sp. NPDC049687]|uniref:hypothetical protein n=1 Tax=Streptomyces sp. NPDC049687 TaxID=3365596 RepID=UPI0037BC06D1